MKFGEEFLKQSDDGDTTVMSAEEYNAQLDSLLRPGETAYSVAETLFTEHYPDILKLTYPRVYETSNRYWSAKSVGICMAVVLQHLLHDRDWRSTPTTYKLLAPSMRTLVRDQMPMLWLSPELLAAVQRTDFDDPIDWMELKLPYEQGIFVLPRNGYVHPEDGECAMIAWARQKAGEYLFPNGARYTLSHNRFIFTTACPLSKGFTWYDSNITDTERPLIRLHNLFWDREEEQPPHRPLSAWNNAPLTRADDQFLEGLGVILFGTFLALNARPQLQGEAKLLRTVKARHGKPERKYWSPNILGQHYRPKNAPQGGTHASPRFHLRRGHFRNQACGAGRLEHRTIWIEPTWVMPVVEAGTAPRTA